MRSCSLLGGLVLLLLLISGCGGDGGNTKPTVATEPPKPTEKPPRPKCPAPSQQVRVTLDGHMGAENAGILIAKKRGYFADVGLHVWVGTPGNPEAPVNYVAAGVDDIGITQQPQVVLGNETEESVVAVGSVISEPTAAMIWLKDSDIREIADLKGKTVAYPGVSFQGEFLENLLMQAGLTLDDVVVLPGGYKLVSTLLQGEVDAIFGGSWKSEGAALEARGAKPVIKPVQELGVPEYDELVVIARSHCLAKYPAMYRHFMAAVARGTAAAMGDPHGITQLIEESLESDPEATRKETEAQVKATLPLLSKDGYIDPHQAASLGTWMRDEDMIEREPPVGKLFTNEYLAG